MKISTANFGRVKLMGPEGEIGTVNDVLVDDDSWSVRYFVVSISHGLVKRSVLVAPEFITEANIDEGRFTTYFNENVLSACPRLEWLQPISLQYKEALEERLGTLAYLLGSALLSPQNMMRLVSKKATTFVDESSSVALRSIKQVLGYKVVDRNGDQTRLDEVRFNPHNWSAEYATTKASFGSQDDVERIAMNRIKSVDWHSRVLHLDITIKKPKTVATPRIEEAWGRMSLAESGVF